MEMVSGTRRRRGRRGDGEAVSPAMSASPAPAVVFDRRAASPAAQAPVLPRLCQHHGQMRALGPACPNCSLCCWQAGRRAWPRALASPDLVTAGTHTHPLWHVALGRGCSGGAGRVTPVSKPLPASGSSGDKGPFQYKGGTGVPGSVGGPAGGRVCRLQGAPWRLAPPPPGLIGLIHHGQRLGGRVGRMGPREGAGVRTGSLCHPPFPPDPAEESQGPRDPLRSRPGTLPLPRSPALESQGVRKPELRPDPTCHCLPARPFTPALPAEKNNGVGAQGRRDGGFDPALWHQTCRPLGTCGPRVRQ